MAQSLSPYPMLKDGCCSRGKLPRVRTQDTKTICFGRLWIFLLLGTLIGVFGLVIGGLYFSLQAVTNSTEHTEIFPSYTVSILVLVTSISVIVLFWRRIKILVLMSVVLCLLTIVLGGIKAILTGTHVLQPFLSMTRCQYDIQRTLCRCYSPYKRSALLNLQYSDAELFEYDFGGVSSCNPVESVIPQLLYTLIVTCTIVVFLCIGTAVLALLVLRIERNRSDFLKDEAYEEVYTVSGSSSSVQDQSDNELDTLVLQSAVSTNSYQESKLLPSNSKGATLDRSRSLRSVKSTASKRDKPLSDLEPQVTSTQSRQGSTDASGIHSLTRTKQLSRSCESFDSLSKSADCTLASKSSDVSSVPQTKGKLKEHRRRGRRAVTLHNLDTETLMVILGLQLRYLQETKELQSKSEKAESQQSRRASTPQPTLLKTSILPPNARSHTPQPASLTTPISLNVRSHTPQPYKTRPSLPHNEEEFGTTLRSASQRLPQNQDLFFSNTFTEREATPDILQDQNCLSGITQGHKTALAVRQGIYNPYLYNQPLLSADNIHYITYSDNMLNHPIQRPRSRPKLEEVFFPPQCPLYQGNHPLPPQPISRPSSRNKQLPPEPLHRGGKSAFHAVETHKLKTNHGRSISPSPIKDLINTVHRPGAADYAELAIRENFQLYPSNIMLKRENQDKSTSKSQEGCMSYKRSATVSEVPPPYAPPPSYSDFLSSCNTSMTSSASSNPEELYCQPNPRHKETTKAMSHPGTLKVTTPGTVSHRSDPGCSHTETIYSNNMNYPLHEHCKVKTGTRMYQNYGRNFVSKKKEIYSASNENRIKENTSEIFYSQVQKRKPQIGTLPVYANSEHVTLNQPISSRGLGSGSNPEYEGVYEYPENREMEPSTCTVVNSHRGKAQVQKGPHQDQYDVSVRPRNLVSHFVPRVLIKDKVVDKSSHRGHYDLSVRSRNVVAHCVPQIVITDEEVDEVFESPPTPIVGQGLNHHHQLPSQSKVSIVTESIQGESVQDDVNKNQTWTERQKFIHEWPKEVSRPIFLKDSSNSSRLSPPGIISDRLVEKHDAPTLIPEKNTKVGPIESIIVTPGEGLAGALMEGRLQQASASERLSSSDSEFAETGV